MVSRILLADDSITIHKVVNKTFEDEGIEVVAVSRGDLAERQMEEINPDLVLADIFMPGKNGYELCEFIKQSPQFRHIPVVLLVGAFEPFDHTEAQRVKADSHLTKPFEARTLVTTVRRLITSSGKPLTGPLVAPQEREQEPEEQSASLNTRPIMSPPFNIDLAAMTNDPHAPDVQATIKAEVDEAAETPAASQSFALDMGYQPADESDSPFSDSPISLQSEPQPEAELSESPFVRTTAALQPDMVSDQTAKNFDFGQLDVSAQDSYEHDVLELTGDDYGDSTDATAEGEQARQDSKIPSLFGNTAQDVMLDFEKLDSPDIQVPDNVVNLDAESNGSYALSLPDSPPDSLSDSLQNSFEADSDSDFRKTQVLRSPVSSPPAWTAQTSETRLAHDEGQFDARSLSFLDSPAEAAADTATTSTLLAMDDPLGDLLQEDRAEVSYQPVAQANEFSLELGAQEFDAPSPVAMHEQAVVVDSSSLGSQSPLDLGDSFNYFPDHSEQQIQFTPVEESLVEELSVKEPVLEEYLVEESVVEAPVEPAAQQSQPPQDEFQQSWSGSAYGFDLATEEPPLASSGESAAYAPEFVADEKAFPPAELPKSEFTASEMWSLEETRFAPIDIEAMPVDEQEIAPQATESQAHGSQDFERGFDFASIESAPVKSAPELQEEAVSQAASTSAQAQPEAAGETVVIDLPPEVIDEIVRRVIVQISDAVVREVAWEVVPDCVERVIERLTRESLSRRA